MSRRGPRRARLLDALALALGAGLAVVAAEGALRVFAPQRSAVTLGMFEQDPHAGYRLAPGYENEVRVPEYTTRIVTDAEGYRVPAAGVAPPAEGAARLLAIGDSFTFGVGVEAEEAFPAALERAIGRSRPGAWVVRNGGVGGYGPLRSAEALAGRQGAWRPDVVVHAVYVGNDLEDAKPDTFREDPVVRDGRMVTPGYHPLARARMFLRTRSHLYCFLRRHLYGLYYRTGLWERSQHLETAGLAHWPPRVRDATWPAARDAIASIAAWAGERGTRYLVMIVPARWQVEEDAWARYRGAWDLPGEAFDRDRAQRVLHEELGALGVETLDLLPPLRRARAAGVRTYHAMDPHWNAAGHELAAQLLEEKLDALGWLDEPGAVARAR